MYLRQIIHTRNFIRADRRPINNKHRHKSGPLAPHLERLRKVPEKSAGRGRRRARPPPAGRKGHRAMLMAFSWGGRRASVYSPVRVLLTQLSSKDSPSRAAIYARLSVPTKPHKWGRCGHSSIRLHCGCLLSRLQRSR